MDNARTREALRVSLAEWDELAGEARPLSEDERAAADRSVANTLRHVQSFALAVAAQELHEIAQELHEISATLQARHEEALEARQP